MLRSLLHLVSYALLCLCEDYYDDDYEYEDSLPENWKKPHGAGKRLINARAADANENPFVGAFFLTSHSRPGCSSSLITPQCALR